MLKPIAVLALILGLLTHPLSAGAAAAPKIALAHGALNARIAPLWIAHEQKFFSKYGVDSTVILVRQIQIMVSGLGTGEIDIALTSGSTLLGAAGGGLDAKMVAALNAKVTYDLVAAPAIKSVKDLRGKRFGIQAFGGGLWMGAMLGLESLGLDPQRDNINVLQIGDQSVIAEEGYQDLVTGLDKKLVPSVEGLRNTQRLLKPRNPKLENIKVEELIDDRIVRRLEESGFIGRLQRAYAIK